MYSVHATSVMASSSLNCTSVMLRNHFIVAVNVDKIAQISIGLYYALLILVESSLFFLLLTVHFKIRRGSHPFFGLLFGCVLLCYIICGVAEAVCQFLFLFGGSSDTLSVVYLIYDLAYAATTALVFCCLIERTIATLWAVSYETVRTWWLFLISVCLSVTGYIYFASFRCRGCIVSAVVTIIIIGGCIALYFLNRKWTILYQKDISFMGKVSLSMRYQIIENMISVRKALLPVIILDSLVTLVDALSSKVTTKIEEQSNAMCYSMTNYIPYILLNHLAMVFEYSIPLYMLFRKAYSKKLPNVCHRIRPIARIQQSRESMIQNVFGKELNVVPTQAEYFAKLQNEWK
ncbi:Serpentine Receptor, class E (Epsilon) [Caenorhabditis elegans]|uniref:Serpentine Receptor, class E (Epsilon) n=1 Tax=Caenorhabditis elegans TaxID=6239 RepID=A0A3B1E639_CAEEL|nr:Serpentine Receptor, class E (Epsilon) [Caenorhabditis elegans]VAY52516.1 Serpentine Receptor, class E (Epsilon) [Caenorhabditis elegans]|eukprot:NP_001355434.1 Uncharacterized protein CELE_C04F5.2 [Caenorhabditis elegans]